MQPRTLPSLSDRLSTSVQPTDRITPFVSLSDYSAGGLIHETALHYDSALRFGPVHKTVAESCPATWVAQRLSTALGEARDTASIERPIHIGAPTTALSHRNTAKACQATLSEYNGCTQEVCLIFDDAALATSPRDTITALGALRGAGFRLGINAQRSWLSLKSASALLMVDAVWIGAAHLDLEDGLMSGLQELRDAGIQVICFDAAWSRANEYLAAGVTHVFRAKSDA